MTRSGINPAPGVTFLTMIMMMTGVLPKSFLLETDRVFTFKMKTQIH